MGVPDGSWICRKEIASSVETAGTSLTGMRTRERRRLPDQSEGGAMTQTRRYTKTSPNLGRVPLIARGTKWNAYSAWSIISASPPGAFNDEGRNSHCHRHHAVPLRKQRSS